MGLRYLEDLVLGERFPCGGFRFSRAEIIDFARQFDPQPFHLDEDAARETYFQGLAASGIHTQAAALGCIVRSVTDVAVVAGASLDQARFFIPVRPDRDYRVTAWFHEVRPTRSNPARGLATRWVRPKHTGPSLQEEGGRSGPA